jgi:hypothetical protein
MRIFTGAVMAAAVAGLISQPGGASAAAAPHQRTWQINTAAGGVGGPGPAGDVDVQACAVTAAGGALYAVDRVLGTAPVIRRIDTRTGALTTVVGDGGLGVSANGTPGTVTNLSNGCGLAVDHAGNLLFSQDYYGNTFPAGMYPQDRVRVLAAHSGRFYGQTMKAGDVYSIAGNGQSGERGDGGPALKAEIDNPGGLAVDSAGNVLVEDTFYDRIRLVAERTGTFYGQSMKAGDIYTIAGNGGIFYTGDGVPATMSAIGLRELPLFDTGQGISLDRAGNLVIADNRNNRIRVVAVRSGTFYGQSMTAGDIYTIAGNGSEQTTGNGGPATSAGVDAPAAVAIDPSGNVLISQQGQCQARVVAASSGQFYGQTMTAGDIYALGGGAACASNGVTVDSAGNAVTAGGGWLGVVAAATGHFYGKSMSAGGQYAITPTLPASEIGNAGPPTRVEISPGAIAFDPAGDLLIAEGTPGSTYELRLVARHTGTAFGRRVRAGHIYTIASGLEVSYVGSPVPGLTTDKFGNILAASDTGVYLIAARDGRFYGKARRAGHVYTIVGGGSDSNLNGVPATEVSIDTSGIAVDRDGNIVIGDWFNVPLVEVVAVRSGTYYGMPMKAGYIYTVAGTGSMSGFEGNDVPGTESVIDPLGLVTDRAGNIVVTDFNDDTVRIIAARSGPDFGQQMMPGYIYGLAGNGTGFGGDGGPAASAELNGAEGVGIDAAGNVLIGDVYNCRVRVVAARSGPFYGRAMKADHIYTIAGSGCLPNQMSPLLPRQHVGSGKFGDGIPATGAELFSPTAVAGAASGAVYMADGYRVRVIAP